MAVADARRELLGDVVKVVEVGVSCQVFVGGLGWWVCAGRR